MGEINKKDKSFKILINKRFTADADSLSGRPFFTEVGADTLNIHSREVWTHPVPTNPQEALNNGIAKYYDKFVLTSDNSSNKSQYLSITFWLQILPFVAEIETPISKLSCACKYLLTNS